MITQFSPPPALKKHPTSGPVPPGHLPKPPPSLTRRGHSTRDVAAVSLNGSVTYKKCGKCMENVGV